MMRQPRLPASALAARAALAAICAVLFASVAEAVRQPSGGGPIWGILTLPSPNCDSMRSGLEARPAGAAAGVTAGEEDGGGSCFTWYYTKWLEAAGARVAPIPYDSSEAQLEKLWSGLNGVLFTGGGLGLGFNTTYVKTATWLYNKVVEEGVTPLHGTCMGFQLLNLITSQDQSVLARGAYDSEDLSLALDATPAASSSRFAAGVGAEAWKTLTTRNVTANLHHDGVPPQSFAANSKLSGFYDLLSTNKDRKGNEFCSTIEGKQAPVTATQWHPERPQFEWAPSLNINHSEEGIAAMSALATYLVRESLKSDHGFATLEDENDALIYKYSAEEGGVPGNPSFKMFQFPAAGEL